MTHISSILSADPALFNDLASALGDGYKYHKILALWPGITGEAMQRVESYPPGRDRAVATLQCIQASANADLGTFAAALDQTYYYALASRVRSKIGTQLGLSSTSVGNVTFNIGSLPVPTTAFPSPISTPVATQPRGGFSRMTRDKLDIQKVLSEYPVMVIRIPNNSYADVQKGNAISGEVLFVASTEDATERADELFAEDVKDANGDESAVRHVYMVARGESTHGSIVDAPKSRGKALGKVNTK